MSHLRQHQIGIWIGLHVVVHDEAHQAVGCGVQRIHVVHVVHAAHLLLDRRRHRLLDGLCIRPHIGCEHLNFRWNDVGELSHGKRGDGDCSHDHHQDRDDHGYDGPVDEKLGHGSIAFRLWLFDFHGAAVLDLLQSLDDYLFAWFDSTFDDPHGSDTVPDFHRPDAHLVVRADDCDLVTSLQFAHGFLRHEQRAAPDFRRRPQPSKLAGAKEVLRIGKGANDLNTACAYVHLAIRKQASPFVRIDGAVSQNQLKWRPVGRNLSLRVGINPVSEVDVLLLADGEIRLDGIYL